MSEAELTAEIDGLNAKIGRLRDEREPLIERLTTEFGPGPVCTGSVIPWCTWPTLCRPRGVCEYGAPPTEEQERKKTARYLRTKLKKLTDALRSLQEHEPLLVVRLVDERYYNLFLSGVDKDIETLEKWRDAKSPPDPTVRTRKRRAADPAQTQADEERRNKAYDDEQARLKDKDDDRELTIGDVQEEISRKWKVEKLKPAYVVPPAFSAFMDATLTLSAYEPELVVSSLGVEQHELFMSEVDGYIETVEALRDVHSLPTKARLEIV